MKQKAVWVKAIYIMCFTRKVNALEAKPECAEMHTLPGVAELQWLTKP